MFNDLLWLCCLVKGCKWAILYTLCCTCIGLEKLWIFCFSGKEVSGVLIFVVRKLGNTHFRNWDFYIFEFENFKKFWFRSFRIFNHRTSQFSKIRRIFKIVGNFSKIGWRWFGDISNLVRTSFENSSENFIFVNFSPGELTETKRETLRKAEFLFF